MTEEQAERFERYWDRAGPILSEIEQAIMDDTLTHERFRALYAQAGDIAREERPPHGATDPLRHLMEALGPVVTPERLASYRRSVSPERTSILGDD